MPEDPNENNDLASATDPAGPSKGSVNALGCILLTLFIDILGIGIVIPVLPELIKDFVSIDGATGKQVDSLAGWYVGLIGASYAFMQFVCAPIMGALSDRYGRRPVILGSLFALGIDFLIQGFAPNVWWLFIGRVFAGMMGGSFSAANAYIADVSTPETRARNFGLVGAMFGLGFIFGPALGGLLGAWHTRLPFFVAGGLALLNVAFGYFVLPESLPKEKRSSFTVAKANPFGTLGRLRVYPLVGALVLPFLCLSLAQRGLENVWVLFTGRQFGLEETENGLTLGLVGICAVIVQGGLVRPIIARIGERAAIKIGIAISTMAFLSYGLATQPWVVLVTIVIGSLGGVTGPAIQSLVASQVEPSEQGKVQGALTSLVGLTNIIAPIFFTTGLFSYFTSEQAPFQLPGIPFLVGAVLHVIALMVVFSVFGKFPKTEGSDPSPEDAGS